MKKIFSSIIYKQNLTPTGSIKKRASFNSRRVLPAKSKDGKNVLIEIAEKTFDDSSELGVQSYYFQRNMEMSKKFAEMTNLFDTRSVFHEGLNKNFYCVAFFKNKEEKINKNEISQKLSDFCSANTRKCDDIEIILNSFLDSYPRFYRSFIRRLPQFHKYRKMLQKQDKLEVCLEHGNCKIENISKENGKLVISNFDFAKENQPIGFDLYVFQKSCNVKKPKGIIYPGLHKAKYDLINYIEQEIGSGTHNEIVYDTFTSELMKNWRKLQKKLKGRFETSPEWCEKWFFHFGKKDKLHVYTIWDEDDLVFLAPLYKRKKRLLFIGTEPDLCDQTGVLLLNEKYIDRAVEYVLNTGMIVDFRYLNTKDPFILKLLRYNGNNTHRLFRSETYFELRPYCRVPFSPSQNLKNDVKRRKNKALRMFESLSLKIDMPYDSNRFKEFVNLYSKSWNRTSIFKINNKTKLFFQDLHQNTDLINFSFLENNKNEALAYFWSYKNEDGSISYSVPTYKKGYSEISPGKILLYDVLEHMNDVKKNGELSVDLGRGGEEYKYWFAKEEKTLVSIFLMPIKRGFLRYFIKSFEEVKRLIAKKIVSGRL